MDKMTIKKIRIAVLGSNGQLGQEFKYLSRSYEYIHFDFFSRETLDITDKSAFGRVLQISYDFIINCAAYTAVDKAENDSELCYAINADACKNLMEYLEGSATKLIHFSSDYVYHTYSGFALTESDPTQPKGVYADSKLKGENIIRSYKHPALILRTSWVMSSFGHNFVKTMLRLGKEKKSLSVVNDQFGAPTYARHLASAVLDIILQVSEDQALESEFDATYNYANEGIITWYDLASQIMQTEHLACQVHPIFTKDYPTAAQRPHWSVLSKKKIKDAFHLEIPHWYSALHECLEALKAKENTI